MEEWREAKRKKADMGKSEEEETLSGGNVWLSDVSDSSLVQRKLVDNNQIASKADY